MRLKYQLENARKLEKELKRLGKELIPNEVQREVGSFGRKVLAPEIASSLSSLPITPVVKAKKKRGIKIGVELLVGVRKRLFLVRWLAFGTKDRTTRQGVSRGSIKRRVAPLFVESIVSKVSSIFRRKMAEAIQRGIKKV